MKGFVGVLDCAVPPSDEAASSADAEIPKVARPRPPEEPPAPPDAIFAMKEGVYETPNTVNHLTNVFYKDACVAA